MIPIPNRGLLFWFLVFVATASAASPYNGLVVFGDSLSDAGQRADPGGPPNATQRLTNRVGPTYASGSGEERGPVSPSLLGQRLGLGAPDPSTSPVRAAAGLPDGENWAVAGYRTDEIYASMVAPGGSVVDGRVRDGYLVGRQVDPDTLFYINGGGNDFLQGRVTSPADAAASARQLAAGVRALQQAGARYMLVWLLPDIGRTPALAGSPLQAVASGLAADFNTELVVQLASVDAEIIALDIPRLFSEVLADPTRYGLSPAVDLAATCFDTCARPDPVNGLGGTAPDPARLLFNDGVHPTVAGQRLIADYAYAILAAPWELTLLPELAHASLRAHQQALSDRRQSERGTWQTVRQWRGFVDARGQRQDFDRQVAAASADGDGYGIDLGGSYRLDRHWRIGAALGVNRQHLEAGEGGSDYRLESYLMSASGEYRQESWWLDGQLSGGYLDYDRLHRRFALGVSRRREHGESEGYVWGGLVRLGYQFSAASDRWVLSPYIGMSYGRVRVDGYRERGDRSTALRVDDQESESRRLGIGLLARVALSPTVDFSGELAREKEFEDDPAEVNLALVNLPVLGFRLTGHTASDAESRVGVALRWNADEALAVSARFGYRRSNDYSQHDLTFSLSWDW